MITSMMIPITMLTHPPFAIPPPWGGLSLGPKSKKHRKHSAPKVPEIFFL